MPKVFQKTGKGRIWQRIQQAKSQQQIAPNTGAEPEVVEMSAETQLVLAPRTTTPNPPVLQPESSLGGYVGGGYPKRDPLKCMLNQVLLAVPGKALTKTFLIEFVLKSEEDKGKKDKDDAYNKLFLKYMKQVQGILTDIFGIDIVAFDKNSSQGYSFEITNRSQSFMKRSQFTTKESVHSLVYSQLSTLDMNKFTATMSSIFSILGFIFMANSMESGLSAKLLYQYLQLMKMNFFTFFHMNEDGFKDFLNKRLVPKHYLSIIPAEANFHLPGNFFEPKERYIWGIRAHYEVDKSSLLLSWCGISKQDPKICKYQMEWIKNESSPEIFADFYESIDSNYFLHHEKTAQFL